MALIGSLVIGISARTAELERGLNRARQQVQSTAASIRGVSASMAASFGAVGAAIGAIGASKGLQEIIRVGTAMEGTRAAFTAITGSAEKARAELAFVGQTSQQLSTDLLNGMKSFQGIAAAARGTTLEGKATRDIFLGVSQAARVLQLSGDDVQGVLNAISQIMSKGTVSSEELRGQIGERLPGAMNIAARAIGVTTQELSDMLKQGQVLANDFLPKFAAQLQREFAGGVEKATQTAGAAFQRARNDITAMAAAAADSGLLRWLAQAAEGFTSLAAAAVGASRTTRNAINEINTQAPGASEQQQRQFVDLAERRARTMQKVQEIEDGIARSTIGKTYLGFDLKQRQQQIANLKDQVREIDRLSQALLDNQRKLEEAAGRETIPEMPTKGVFDAETEKVKKQVDEMRKAMDAVQRQADMGMPGLKVAEEQSKILLKGLQDITEELAKYPGLAANLPKGIQDTIAAARLDVVQQTITDITARSKEMRAATASWKEPLEQNREELRFIESELNALLTTFGKLDDQGARNLEIAPGTESFRQLDALIQRAQELRQGLEAAKDARKADRAEEAAAAREAKQAEEFLESLRAEAKLRQESLKIRNQETAAGQRQIALMELEATIRDRGITLDPTQRAEAERLALMKASAALEAENAKAREEALSDQREAQRQILTGMAQEINLRGQLLSIQKLGTTEREIAEKALTLEAELIANGTTITEEWRSAVQQLATAWGQAGAAIEKAAFFRDLSEDITHLENLIALQGLSRDEREREIALLEARQQLNRALSSDEETQLRREIATQQARSAALEKATFFRDLGEDIADLRALVAAQRLSRREREIEMALIQEKRRLNRALAPEEEAQLKRQLALQRDLNEELSRPRPLRDFAESTQDFFLGIEEGAVRALEGLEDTLVRFAETGSFRSPEADQTLADLRGVAIERRALIREMETLQGLPQDQQIGESLRQKERLNQLQREVDILDERKKVLDDTAKSQNMLNQLFRDFYRELLQASVRTLATGPMAGYASGIGMGQQQGSGWTQLLMQGLNLVAGIWGGGTATAGQAAGAVEGFRQAGYTQGIVAHRGGLVGRDAFPRIALPTQRFAAGGLVMSRGGDNVPALLQSGERVLSRQETARLAQLEQAVQLARNARQGDETPQSGHTINMIFPNVTTRQDADALRRSGSQIQNQLITAVERSRARNNTPSSAR